MNSKLKYFIDIYEKYKSEALCIDVERCFVNGPISIIGAYHPSEGPIVMHSFIRGKNYLLMRLSQFFQELN